MKCKVCGESNTEVIYHDVIRDGRLHNFTTEKVKMYQCNRCGVIWHDRLIDTSGYYQSEGYRMDLEGTTKAEDFYVLHDKENLDKFYYTGTDIFRNQCVMDIGCGAGAFLDFIQGVANKIVAVEPSKTYQEILKKKGYYTFAYMAQAMEQFVGGGDLAVSFDVIEHVDDPLAFLENVYTLLSKTGKAIIGTPTDAPVMRELLGYDYEKKLLFSMQHLWIFGEENLRLLSEKANFKSENITFRYFQRYGFANLLGWMYTKQPNSDIRAPLISKTLDHVWKSECENQSLADYIVLYLTK